MVMADENDYDRARRRRRRGRKDFENEYIPASPMPSKTPIILAKPQTGYGDKVTAINQSEPPDMTPSGPEPVLISRGPPDKPPILLKPRDSASVTVATSQLNGSVPNIPGLVSGEGAGELVPTGPRPGLNRAVPANHNLEELIRAKLAPPTEMTRSIKLIDDTFIWSENAMDMLLDQTDFLVVGVLGLQGVGKSTLLSHLIGVDEGDLTRLSFRPQPSDARDVCGHQTAGIDMFVTSERVIYLDSQPLLSASVLHSMIHHDKKYPTDYTSPENCVEMQSLQIASFLFTVCNVVLVVADWFMDPTLIRCLKAAEMLKPPMPSHDTKTVQDYYPQIAFVLNHASREDFSVDTYLSMQNAISRMMGTSHLHYTGAMTMAGARSLVSLNKRTVKSDVNLYLLPDDRRHDNGDALSCLLPNYQGQPGYESLVASLRRQLLAVPRHPLTHTTLSEKNWFHYAGRTWDSIKKSQLFSEYNRLLP